jgi:hypothetical protein
MPDVTTGLVKEHANLGDLVRKCRDNVQGTSLDISGFLGKRGGIITAGRAAIWRKTNARVHNLFPGTKFTVVLDDALFRDVDAIAVGTTRYTSIVYNLMTTDDLEMNQV